MAVIGRITSPEGVTVATVSDTEQGVQFTPVEQPDNTIKAILAELTLDDVQEAYGFMVDDKTHFATLRQKGKRDIIWVQLHRN